MWWPIFSLFVVSIIQLTKADGCNDLKPDFSAPGRRISEQKCQEYNWDRKQLEKCSEDAAKIDYPYLGAMGYKMNDTLRFRCGALLISPKYALTAAHCIHVPHPLSPAELIRFGNRNLNDKEPHVEVKILKTIVHPEYLPDWNSKDNDIALVELNPEVPFSKSIYPACLWTKAAYEGVENIISPGWPKKKGQREDLMTEVKLNITETKRCLERIQNHFNFPLKESRICAFETNPSCDLIPFTSPMMTLINLDGKTEDQMPHAIGMASFGEKCGQVGIYTRIYSYIDWIEQTVWK